MFTLIFRKVRDWECSFKFVPARCFPLTLLESVPPHDFFNFRKFQNDSFEIISLKKCLKQSFPFSELKCKTLFFVFKTGKMMLRNFLL